MNDKPKMTTNGTDREPEVSILFKQFLETVHPSVVTKVSGLWERKTSSLGGTSWELVTPDLRLHCPNCEGERTFRCRESYPSLLPDAATGRFVLYRCGDCQKATKLFSLWIVASEDGGRVQDAGRGQVYKYGENPPFGTPVPNKLLRLFGSDGQTFLKGRQCENQGFGVGAFAYYRRVVENHKNDLLEAVIRVCETVGASPELISELPF